MSIENIIDKDKLINIENNKVYNFLNESPSSKFYNEMFSNGFQEDKKPELYDQLKQTHIEEGSDDRIMEEIVSFLEKELKDDSIVIEIGGGVYQQRSANAYKRLKNYFPLDISYSSTKRYTENFNKIGIVADATKLPFKDNSIDCIFTHTFLEHPIDPEAVLKEISRVLKPNGMVIHNDAWFCRWWHRYGIIGLKKFRNMSLKEKLISIAAGITEFKLLRIPPILLGRLIKIIFNPKENLNLPYKKLKPNYTLYLGCDEDAASTIDPLDVIMFYESRNFTNKEKLSFFQKLFLPNRYIVLVKMP